MSRPVRAPILFRLPPARRLGRPLRNAARCCPHCTGRLDARSSDARLPAVFRGPIFGQRQDLRALASRVHLDCPGLPLELPGRDLAISGHVDCMGKARQTWAIGRQRFAPGTMQGKKCTWNLQCRKYHKDFCLMSSDYLSCFLKIVIRFPYATRYDFLQTTDFSFWYFLLLFRLHVKDARGRGCFACSVLESIRFLSGCPDVTPTFACQLP